MRNLSFAIGLLALVAVGCSDARRKGDNGQLASGSTNGASSLVGNGTGSFPLLPGLEHLHEQYREGPQIEITSPTRAAYMPPGPTTLVATVKANGQRITEVKVNGVTATLASDNTISVPITLTPGANTIVVEAVDRKNKRTERHVTVLAGQFGPETAVIPQSSAMRLTDDGLNIFEPDVVQGVEAQRAAITQQVMAANYGKDTSARGFSFGTIGADLDAVNGGLAFRVDVNNVALEFQVKKKILWLIPIKKRGTIRAQRLSIHGLIQFGVDANGQLTSQVTNVTSSVAGFSVPSFARKYESKIKNAFVDGFRTQGAAAATEAVKKALDQAPTSGTINQTLLGQTIRNEWKLSSVRFDDWGMTAVFGGNVRAVNPIAGSNDRSLLLGTPVSDLVGAGPGWNGALAVHQDSINQALHAAWRAGALDYTLDSSTYQQLMPGNSPLDSTALIAMAPLLKLVVPDALPLEMRLSAQLPPVARVRPNAPHMLDLTLGCVRVQSQLIDAANGTTIDMGEATFTIQTAVTVVEDNGKLRLVPAPGQTTVHVDVLGTTFTGAEVLLEQLGDTMAGPLLESAMANMAGVPLPQLPGQAVGALQFMAHRNSLVAAGTIR